MTVMPPTTIRRNFKTAGSWTFEAIAREAREFVGRQIQAQGVVVKVAADLPTVYGDCARLVEVVQNLIDNAVKYLGNQPPPHIEIGARAAAPDLQTLFGVCDHGVGTGTTFCFTLADKLVKSHG